MAKIIVFDVETAPMEVAAFTLYPESIGHNMILKDEYIICACWKEVGEKKTHHAQITKAGNDKNVCLALRDALSGADLIVGQNIKNFDIRKLNARLIRYGITPLALVPMVDTLLELRKVAHFPSHRLDYLGKSLLGAGKLQTEPDLWLRAMKGEKKAINSMVEYCKVDVQRTEDLYLKIRPYISTHPHMGAIMGRDRVHTCPKCRSDQYKLNGIRYSPAGLKKRECQCKKCYSYFRINESKPKPTGRTPGIRLGKRTPAKTKGGKPKRVLFV